MRPRSTTLHAAFGAALIALALACGGAEGEGDSGASGESASSTADSAETGSESCFMSSGSQSGDIVVDGTPIPSLRVMSFTIPLDDAGGAVDVAQEGLGVNFAMGSDCLFTFTADWDETSERFFIDGVTGQLEGCPETPASVVDTFFGDETTVTGSIEITGTFSPAGNGLPIYCLDGEMTVTLGGTAAFVSSDGAVSLDGSSFTLTDLYGVLP